MSARRMLSLPRGARTAGPHFSIR
ncbi:MAG: hypothetical protein EXQ52_04315 [Bryobacterales bacterium]|nr:hypothetical protein [Bryobacterales bacterium]